MEHLSTEDGDNVRTEGRRRRTRQETRDRLLEAAFRMILQDGYAAFTIARVADELRMTAANIYTHVSSRMELADAVNAMQFDRLEQQLEAVSELHLPAPGHILQLVLVNLEYHQEIGRRTPFLADLVDHAAREGWHSHREILLSLRRLFDRVIRRGMHERSLAPDLEPRFFKAAFDAMRPVMDPVIIRQKPEANVDAEARAVVELIIRGLGGSVPMPLPPPDIKAAGKIGARTGPRQFYPVRHLNERPE